MIDDETKNLAIDVLQAVGVAQAANEQLPVNDLARMHDMSVSSLRVAIEQFERMGLLFSGLEEGNSPILLDAGRQYLKRRGDVPLEVLNFLPAVVDDLDARQALIHAGTRLVDEFRYQLLNGTGVDHAVELVPPAFAQAIDESLALNLFAASVALMAHLSDGRPASCVAEEIVAVQLIEEARSDLEVSHEKQNLTESEVKSASAELKGLFELFEDDDVLDLFEMDEPADAAVAGHDPVKRQAGVVDQRIEAWFKPFGWATPTGYLGE